MMEKVDRMSVSYSAPQVSRCVKATDLQVKVSQIIFRLKFPTPLQMISVWNIY